MPYTKPLTESETGNQTIVEVNGEKIFTARWVMEQMNAQNYRIDRAYRIAAISVSVSVLAFILSVIL